MDRVVQQELVNKEIFVETFQLNIYHYVLKFFIKFSDKLITVYVSGPNSSEN